MNRRIHASENTRTRSLFLFGLLMAPGIVSAQSTPVPVVSPSSAERQPAAGPVEWTVIESRRFVSAPPTSWTVYLEAAETGTAVSPSRSVPIRQTRIRIDENLSDDDRTPLAIVQHEDNFVVEILAPDDPKTTAPPIAVQSETNPWPNSSGFNFIESEHALDVNDNDRNEIAISYYSTVGDSKAHSMILLESDGNGKIVAVQSAEFVDTIDPAEIQLIDLYFPDGAIYPIFKIRFLPLEDCRFLALLGIRGETDCRDCCAMPIFLKRHSDGIYRTTYLRAVQRGLLDRVRTDIALVAAGEADQPLSSADQAALARAASFFYLTGQAANTREHLEKTLGDRKDLYQSKLFLDEIETYFLGDTP